MSREIKYVEINEKYIRGYFKENKYSLTEYGTRIGRSGAYVKYCLQVGRMDMTAFKLLCVMSGMDEKKATAPDAQKVEPKCSDSEIIEYIKDLGKIHTDILREMKEVRREQKELVENLTRAIHDLDVYLRNICPNISDEHRKTNNTLSMMRNYMEKKGEQQCRK